MDSRYFFNSSPFLSAQGKAEIVEIQQGISGARLAIFKNQTEGCSPLKAPFGSIEIFGPYSSSGVYQLLDRLDEKVRELKLQTIRITHPPDGYDTETSYLIAKAMQKHGFQIVHQDLNFHLEVEGDFKKHLHRSERWKLNKSKRSGYRFHPIAKPIWDEVFPLLLRSRERKGFILSMNQAELENAFLQFPKVYEMWGVSFENQLVAMAITVRVNSEILYVFYTADDLNHRKLSPVVLLHEGLYQYSMEEKFRLLDLGTASVKGLVNGGVATFKRNLGGVASLKQSWVKRY